MYTLPARCFFNKLMKYCFRVIVSFLW